MEVWFAWDTVGGLIQVALGMQLQITYKGTLLIQSKV